VKLEYLLSVVALALCFIGCGAKTNTPLPVKSAVIEGHLLLINFVGDYQVVICDVKNVETRIMPSADGTEVVVEEKDAASGPYQTTARSIKIYVRTERDKMAWDYAIGRAYGKFYKPQDVLPETTPE
jgi:hypothetical protein